MSRLIKLTPVAVIATLLAGCGVLEWNHEVPNPVNSGGAGNTQLPSLSGDAGMRTVASATDNQMADQATGQFGGQVKEIFKSDRCNELSRGGFIWFTDSVVLNDWIAPLGEALIKDIQSQIDFSQQGVLLVDFGVAASSGAGVELLSNQLVRSGKEAVFQIRKNKPDKSKKQIQMVTHPCSMYSMPKTGFDVLVVQNEQGDRLTSFKN